jgi:hypothetical protein
MPSPPVPATPSSYVLPSNFELGGTRRQSTNRQECSPHDFTPDEKETEKREIFTNSCLLGAFVTARIDNHQYKRVSFPLLVLSNSTALSPHPHTHTLPRIGGDDTWYAPHRLLYAYGPRRPSIFLLLIPNHSPFPV